MGTQSEQDYFPTLDLSSTQADASSHAVRHSYLVFPGEPPYVGSKPRRNFIAILGTSCSPHYLSWPSKGGAGWKWSLYLGQILICFFLYYRITPSYFLSSLFQVCLSTAGWALVCHSVLLHSSAQGRIICTEQDGTSLCLTLLFHSVYHIPTSDWCNTVRYLKPQKPWKTFIFFFLT